MGMLGVTQSATQLSMLARDKDPLICSADLDSLRLLRDPTAVGTAVAALDHPATQLAALEFLREYGDAEQTDAVAAVTSSSRSLEVLTNAIRALSTWQTKQATSSSTQQRLQSAIATIQAESGLLIQWHVCGPVPFSKAREVREAIASSDQSADLRPLLIESQPVLATNNDGHIELHANGSDTKETVSIAFADLSSSQAAPAQFLASSNGSLHVWLNGRSVFERETVVVSEMDSDQFKAELSKGMNRLIVQVSGVTDSAQFHVRFRRLSSSADHERLAQHVLQNAGDAERGRALFLNQEKTLCTKCHSLNGQGGRIGPDLTGVGSRFSRIHLIESILEPSRTIAVQKTQ